MRSGIPHHIRFRQQKLLDGNGVDDLTVRALHAVIPFMNTENRSPEVGWEINLTIVATRNYAVNMPECGG